MKNYLIYIVVILLVIMVACFVLWLSEKDNEKYSISKFENKNIIAYTESDTL